MDGGVVVVFSQVNKNGHVNHWVPSAVAFLYRRETSHVSRCAGPRIGWHSCNNRCAHLDLGTLAVFRQFFKRVSTTPLLLIR